MANSSLSAERLRELLHYEPLTGVFTWRASRRGVKVGEAGCLCEGRRRIQVDTKQYLASRLAVLYVTGQWPLFEVDHKDTNPANDAWNNLRDVPSRVNTENQRKARRDNKLGVLGVSKINKRFMAQITLNGMNMYLGMFGTEAEAHSAYVEAKRKFHTGCTL